MGKKNSNEYFYISNKAKVTLAIIEKFGTLENFCLDYGLDYQTALRGLISSKQAHITLIESIQDAGIEVEIRK